MAAWTTPEPAIRDDSMRRPVGDDTETAEHPTTHDASERHGTYVRTDRPPAGH